MGEAFDGERGCVGEGECAPVEARIGGVALSEDIEFCEETSRGLIGGVTVTPWAGLEFELSSVYVGRWEDGVEGFWAVVFPEVGDDGGEGFVIGVRNLKGRLWLLEVSLVQEAVF